MSVDRFADYLPTYAVGGVLVIVGIIIGGLVERFAFRKRLEKYIDERFALNEEYLVEALEEYRHPLYEVQLDEEPLAPWERELLEQHAQAGTFTPEERSEEYRGGPVDPDPSRPYMWKGTQF